MPARAARSALPRRRRSGFSLIEIMAVMLILGVILMSIVPAIDSMVPIYRLRGAAREVASLMELAQSEAVGTRKEYQIAYSVDRNAYWLVLPPRDPAEDQEQDPMGGLGGPAGESNKEGRPIDDVEHGPPPVDADAAQDPRAARTSAEREALLPKGLPTDVVFVSVIIGDEEKRTGEVMVPFSHLGAGGTHIVGLRLENGGDADQIWVKFNALTRTIEYHEERPTIRTLSQGDLR